ncbi:hypothetical protein BU26DRAFT_7246 [Trematosphaeria pertusa]|uniref:Uncharacterized protein n=1 Tax=Trematosphaeria pertusa TaxID=390896 RepID=A0A6A6IYU2_9PLEO|nr:uncharacterized protein BU26DRAFT_7246 [Trematosphaeria pertusa]KAF2255741.1 hypothetical protein BU26DRAFT_7246 [Trematosphaeria pertusa]
MPLKTLRNSKELQQGSSYTKRNTVRNFDPGSYHRQPSLFNIATTSEHLVSRPKYVARSSLFRGCVILFYLFSSLWVFSIKTSSSEST